MEFNAKKLLLSMYETVPVAIPCPEFPFTSARTYTSGPFGGFVYVRADVKGNSGHGIATGTVSYMDNSSFFSLNSMTLNSKGTAATPDGYYWFSVGQHTLLAKYGGDFSFNQSSGSVNFTIAQASTTTSLTVPPKGIIQGTSTID